MDDGYRGLLGAFPYAYRRSGSWLFRSYVAVSALLTAGLAALFGFGLVVLVARTASVPGGSLTLSRAFFVLVGLFVVAPVVAPTLFVARRHRRESGDAGGGTAPGADTATATGRPGTHDALFGAVGYLFLASLYVGLVISVPTAQQSTPSGALAPVVGFLYDLPQLAGLGPPLAAALLILAVHRFVERRAAP